MQNCSSSLVRAFSLLVVAAFAAGCGGGGSDLTADSGSTSGDDTGSSTPAGTSGVAGTKTMSTLTDAEKKKICDWTAGLYGGYGGETVCDDGSGLTLTLSAPTNQASCLAQSSMIKAGCAATVAQLEACTRSISTCDESDDAAANSDCNALFSCYTTGP